MCISRSLMDVRRVQFACENEVLRALPNCLKMFIQMIECFRKRLNFLSE